MENKANGSSDEKGDPGSSPDIKVSIIIPVYNAEEYLKECLDSVLGQTLREIEVICIDDCSSDNSAGIIKEFAEKDERVKYIQMARNSGAGPARNKGLEIASGEYISFIDADDFIIEKAAYEKLYEFASRNQADVVGANLKIYRGESNLEDNSFIPDIKEKSLISPKDYGIPWYFQKNLYKKSFLDEHNIIFPDYLRGQDPVFLTNVLVNVDVIYGYPLDFYAYKPPTTNKINSKEKERDYLKHFQDSLNQLNSAQFHETYSQYEKRLYIFITRQLSSDSLMENIETVFGENSKYMEFYKSEKNILPEDTPIKVSIIIPVYNVEDYLGECLDSVVNQTLREIEIICVNDGSTDSSPQILAEYAALDGRIKVIDKENAGLGAARNTGMEHVKGEYIGFIDSDDWVDTGMFQKLYENAKLHGSDMVMCPMHMVNEDGEKSTNPYYSLDCFSEDFYDIAFDYKQTKDFIFEIAVNAFNKIYRTEFVKDIGAEFPEGLIFEDNPFFFKSFLKAEKVSLVRDFLYFHRVNRSGSIIGSADAKFFDIIEIMDLCEKEFKSLPDYGDYKLDLMSFKVDAIIHFYFSVAHDYRPEFYKLIKEEFQKMKLTEEETDNLTLRGHYQSILNSQTHVEFELYIENQKLQSEIHKLNKQNKELETKIYSLTRENEILSGKNKPASGSFFKKLVNSIRKNPYLFILTQRSQGLKNMMINIRGYRAICKNNLVDREYYLETNSDVRLLGMNPIIHYIYHGYKEGRKPNPSFDADYYLRKNADVRKSNINPLVHYSLYGIKEEKKYS